MTVGLRGCRGDELVVGLAEDGPGKQLLAVEIPGEGAGFAHERSDDVAVVDAGLLGVRPGIARDLDAGVMETHGRLADAGEQVGVDQAGRHGVGAVFHPRGGIARHACGVLLGVGITVRRQGPQAGQLFAHAGGALEVGGGADLADEGRVSFARSEVRRAAQNEMIAQAAFEMLVGRFHVAVFIRPAGIDRVRHGAQVFAEGEILGVETARGRPAFELMRRRRAVVGLHLRGHTAQPPERVLQARLQRQARFRLARHRPLPVRIRQHDVA